MENETAAMQSAAEAAVENQTAVKQMIEDKIVIRMRKCGRFFAARLRAGGKDRQPRFTVLPGRTGKKGVVRTVEKMPQRMEKVIFSVPLFFRSRRVHA